MKSATMDAPTMTGTAQTTRKLNCWEYKKCGRQPQGPHVKELGLCPASTETALDDVHDGTNAGRACWMVSGTYCKGVLQGTFAQKFKSCEACDFYQKVRQEEFPNFFLSAVLLGRMHKKAG